MFPRFSPGIWPGGGYLHVDSSVGHLIDWYNVQFYNRTYSPIPEPEVCQHHSLKRAHLSIPPVLDYWPPLLVHGLNRHFFKSQRAEFRYLNSLLESPRPPATPVMASCLHLLSLRASRPLRPRVGVSALQVTDPYPLI